MEFIKQEDLDLITACAYKEVDELNFLKLKKIYTKLEYICILLKQKGFEYTIRKDPRKQAGRNGFVFQEYQWAKIYPAEYFKIADDKFAYIIAFTDVVHFHLMGIKEFQHHEASKTASNTCWTDVEIENADYHKIVDDFIAFDKKYRKLFIETGASLGIIEFTKIKEQMKKAEVINLLKYKNQVILQGPPGTGKTKLAKELAYELIPLSDEVIIRLITPGLRINTVKGNGTYTVLHVNAAGKKIKLLRETTGTDDEITFSSIITSYKEKRWENQKDQNDDRMSVGVAKYLYDNLFEGLDQFKIIQFHPSYGYEDFVRGIVAKPNEDGEGILYKAENKILGSFASLAYSNHLMSAGKLPEHSLFQLKLNLLLDNIRTKIEEGTDYLFGDKSTGSIIGIKEDGLLYNFPSRKEIRYKVLFSDLEKVFNIRHLLKKTIDLRDKEKEIGLTMRGKYPYYYMLLMQLNEIEIPSLLQENELPKNYVLIIDEINRANLSSVLGELIYALEYRGEALDSIYDVDGTKIILPPNLYIIGTMNTADRSVGHIDYAIRRRFAFVDVLPKDLSGEPSIKFDLPLFDSVKNLFTTDDYKTRSAFLSPEFEPSAVALGHSYFIDKSAEGGSMAIRLEYEIKPILREYVRDGVLTGEGVNVLIENLQATI